MTTRQAAGDWALDVWMLVLAVLGIVISFGVGLVAVYYARQSAGHAERSADHAERSVTLTQKGLDVQGRQLQLQEEQAALRPDLSINGLVERYEKSRTVGILTVSVSNKGKVSAHNVHGWLSLNGEYFLPPRPRRSTSGMPLLSPDVILKRSWGHIFSEDTEPNEQGYYSAKVYEKGALVIHSQRVFEIPLRLLRSGSTAVRYRLVCDEGNAVEGWFNVEIPEQNHTE